MGDALMRGKRRAPTGSKSAPARSKDRQPPANRRRHDPFAREWVPLPAAARKLGFDWRTIRRHIADQDFVRVLGERWYVRWAEFQDWWNAQRPTGKRAAQGRGK
jgi:hypothetical protein